LAGKTARAATVAAKRDGRVMFIAVSMTCLHAGPELQEDTAAVFLSVLILAGV